MDKAAQLFAAIQLLIALFFEELQKERARSGKTDVELLNSAGAQVGENDLLALKNLAKYRDAQGGSPPPTP